MPAQGQSSITERRRHVADLWLRGGSLVNIAVALGVSESTIHRDVTAIRADLQRTHAAEIDDARNRSLAVLRLVQQTAWVTFGKVKDNSNNKTGLLNVILTAEERIARIEGTLGADHVSQTTVNVLGAPAWHEARAALLAALHSYPDARMAAAEALLALEAGQAPPPTPIHVVDAAACERDGEGHADDDE